MEDIQGFLFSCSAVILGLVSPNPTPESDPSFKELFSSPPPPPFRRVPVKAVQNTQHPCSYTLRGTAVVPLALGNQRHQHLEFQLEKSIAWTVYTLRKPE